MACSLEDEDDNRTKLSHLIAFTFQKDYNLPLLTNFVIYLTGLSPVEGGGAENHIRRQSANFSPESERRDMKGVSNGAFSVPGKTDAVS